MNDAFLITMSIWGLISTVLLFIMGLDTLFSDDDLLDRYRAFCRFAIDNSHNLNIVGKVILVPTYTFLSTTATIPALMTCGLVYVLFKGIYVFLMAIFFKIHDPRVIK